MFFKYDLSISRPSNIKSSKCNNVFLLKIPLASSAELNCVFPKFNSPGVYNCFDENNKKLMLAPTCEGEMKKKVFSCNEGQSKTWTIVNNDSVKIEVSFHISVFYLPSSRQCIIMRQFPKNDEFNKKGGKFEGYTQGPFLLSYTIPDGL